MPTYIFRNEETGEEFEDCISIATKEELLIKNPHIKQVPTTFGVVSGIGGVDSKTDNTWKEVLSKVAEAHPESELGRRYGNKNHTQIKVAEVVKKHRDKWKNR